MSARGYALYSVCPQLSLLPPSYRLHLILPSHFFTVANCFIFCAGRESYLRSRSRTMGRKIFAPRYKNVQIFDEILSPTQRAINRSLPQYREVTHCCRIAFRNKLLP